MGIQWLQALALYGTVWLFCEKVAPGFEPLSCSYCHVLIETLGYTKPLFAALLVSLAVLMWFMAVTNICQNSVSGLCPFNETFI